MREAPFKELKLIVENLTPAIVTHLDRPFAFYGHSMGALIAFEIARALRKEGQDQPVHLFVAGKPAPPLPQRLPPISNLPDSEFSKELQRRYGSPSGLSSQEMVDLLEVFLPLIRADVTAVETYAYVEETALSCPISAFGGQEDLSVSKEEIAPWEEQTDASFSLRVFPGDHFFPISSQAEVIDCLKHDLQRFLET